MLNLRTEIETAVGRRPVDIAPLSGGCIGQVYRIRLAGGETVVAKFDDGPAPKLATEAMMLGYLRQHSQLPVPTVLFSADHLLIMEFLPGDSRFNDQAQAHAAELLAALHDVSVPLFGFAQETLIGGLPQPNEWMRNWLDFFRERRVMHMAVEAAAHGRLPVNYLGRLENFCAQLDQWLREPARPSLLHGDVWTTNVLAVGDRITGFVDPAIYYGHPEIELAFTTLFGTFGEPFFKRYQALRPLPSGFFETRRDIYNLYPLLVHVNLFGGGYVSSVDTILRRFGF
ncbi:MAG: aminoglycoside phosphotransferase [Chloroflexota bacterium]|nr:fructosamine kinase family protein [Ardenticatenaceae bacterium]GIK55135.1 MAG: aminoglycoside phosphotransferase [Chloroflexota bacterium]